MHSQRSPERGDSERPTLLVIAGDRAFVALAENAGEVSGFTVKSSAKARDLEPMCVRYEPRAIIFDFFSPDMDGIELLNWLHERQSNLPVLLTAERDSIFLGLAKQLAAAKGLHNVELMMASAGDVAVRESLIRHLSAIETRDRMPCKSRKD